MEADKNILSIINKNSISSVRQMEEEIERDFIPSIGVVSTKLQLLDYEVYFRRNYVVRYNEVSNKYEKARLYVNVDSGNEEEIVWDGLSVEELMNDMIRGRAKSGKLTKDEVTRMLSDRRLVPAYCPLKGYFSTIMKDTTYDKNFDYIEDFGSYLKVEGGEDEQKRWLVNLKKSLVRTVKCAIDDKYFNKHALILFSADQSVGKTSYWRTLTPPPLKPYYYEGAIGQDKDSQTVLAKNFIIMIDELANLSRVDINVLKATMSKLTINIRLPYAATFSDFARRASIYGTTNRTDFLTDSQNVRWLVFNVSSIDKSYGNIFTGEYKIDINKIWRQAYELYLEGYACELTANDLAVNEENNALYSATSLEKELINTYFVPATSSDNGKAGYRKAQSSEIYEHLCNLLTEDGKEHSLKALRQNVFFIELSRLDGWKKTTFRSGGRILSGYHYIVKKEIKNNELF
jgi:hypothetical protein